MRRDLAIRTAGGVGDLCRVTGVLALLELTPDDFFCSREDQGMVISLSLCSKARDLDLCLARLRALPAVLAADAGAPRSEA